MSRRKKSTPEEHEEDWGSDDFDVDLDSSGPSGRPAGDPLASISLTSDQVAAVRFNTTRPGYSFEQVEIFVDQVKETLSALEHGMYEKDVALYESKEEQGDLQDRIATLAATIEVFRAKGDPVLKSDGSYMTESQKSANGPEMEELQNRLQETNSLLTQATTEVAVLQGEISRLSNLLQRAEVEKSEAEAAEEELRTYIDETLGPWLAQQQSVSSSGDAEPPLDSHISTPSESQDSTDTPSMPEIPPGVFPLPEVAQPPAQPPTVASGTDLGGDDWGDDAPRIGIPQAGPESEPQDDESDEPTVAKIPATKKPTRGKAKLIDAPELQG